MKNNSSHFIGSLQDQLNEMDQNHLSKSNERIITEVLSPTQVEINDQTVTLFNSNDYLGLRMNKQIAEAEHQAAARFGVGAGAVRFISGTFAVHKELEEKIAAFHGRDDAILFSSAYAANLGVLTSLINYSKERPKEVIVISDELNHRSIIDGVRLSGLPSEDKAVYKHRNYDELEQLLETNKDRYQRAIIVTDGVFSMLGTRADLAKISSLVKSYDSKYEHGVLLVVDDCHGVAATGPTGRGSEEIDGVQSDVLVGTFGKGFGCEGGYVVGNKVIIKYLREKSASYIFSNPIPPGAAAGATKAIAIAAGTEGAGLRKSLNENIARFKSLAKAAGIDVTKNSDHPIQPFVTGESSKALSVAKDLSEKHQISTTPITFPAVAKDAAEIRIQISAAHTDKDIEKLVKALSEAS